MSTKHTGSSCHGCGAQAETFIVLDNTPLQIERLADQPGGENSRSQQLRVAKCVNCGLLQQVSKPLDASYYDEYEQSATTSEAMTTYQASLAQELVSDYALKGSQVLEIGAGDGYFAQTLQGLGVNIVALEPGGPSVESIKQRGVRVVHSDFKIDAVAEFGLFDAVISRQVISHVEPLGRFLDDIAKVVKPSGHVIFECPNIVDSLLQGRFVDFLPDYRSYLAVASLTQLMEARGFRLWAASPRWSGEYFLATFIRQADTTTDIQRSLSALKAELGKDLKAGRKVAVWGAGGRGISLLAQLGLGPDDIAYVVDSSPTKQGKFTPTSDIVVKGPQAITDDPVDTILVTPVNYAAEILQELRDGRAFRGDVIIPFPTVQRIKA